MNDPALRRCARVGFGLLAFYVPLGLTFEALHALKVRVYLGSELRRELWRLAHAHGAMLGLLLLVFAAIAPVRIPEAGARASIARLLVAASLLMPLGFLLGGVLNREGDPSLAILAVPVGAVLLCVGLVRAALAARA